jgi:hypothetical protein
MLRKLEGKSTAMSLMRDVQGPASMKLAMFKRVRASGGFAQEDPVKRLGFRMTRHGRNFNIIDSAGGRAPASKTRMSLAEVEHWIGEHI